MAQMESWEAATEFGIPEVQWAEYDARRRSDDIYIACLASAFDSLRIEDTEARRKELTALANTLVLYSRSAAAQHLSGVEKSLNQLYSAALYYLAGFPATGILLAREQGVPAEAEPEERFLLGFLRRDLDTNIPLGEQLAEMLAQDLAGDMGPLHDSIMAAVRTGLRDNPRAFIAARFALACMEDFEESNVWSALREHAAHYTPELWRPFLGNAESFPIWELLPSQMTALRSGLFGASDDTFSLQMPTSSGKTALCELLIYHEVKARNRRVLFLVPFRALAAEIRDGMSRRLTGVGVTVVASHGGNIPTRSEASSIEDADVLVATPEKFSALLQMSEDLANRYGTIICDEGHLIDDDTRGLQYELLLTRLRGTEETPRKIVFMSAILPNVDEIHAWLGGHDEGLASSSYRPVPLDYAFLTAQPRARDTWQLEFNPLEQRPRNYFLLRFLCPDDFRYIKPSTGRPNLVGGWRTNLSLAAGAALKAARHGSVAVFTTTRRSQGVAGICRKLLSLCEKRTRAARGLPDPSHNNAGLLEFVTFVFGEDYQLPRLVRFGIGFHHGTLPQEIRRAMEEGIQAGTIRILVCTSTLAEGVNLPIRTLVMHTMRRYDRGAEAWIYLPKRTVKNIIGRAGRAGKETRGRVIFVSENERDVLEEVLRDEGMEAAKGALYGLIQAIDVFRREHRIDLNNDIFEAQPPEFLSLIDSIDFALLDLIPAETPQEDIERHVELLLERTLAAQFCDTDRLRECLSTVFRLRAEHLRRSVSREAWPVLRKTGASPRFWQFTSDSGLLENPAWLSLEDPLDDEWLDAVILRLIEHSTMQIDADPATLRTAVVTWMSGGTYVEMATACDRDIDTLLELLCRDIGYRLQDGVAKLVQLAINLHGEDNVSETARSWASLLQYGLGSLQQLDIYDAGCSERLAAWGVSRYLAAAGVTLRGGALRGYLRDNSDDVRSALSADARVPGMSEARFCQELRLA